jgi:hypothetical protein
MTSLRLNRISPVLSFFALLLMSLRGSAIEITKSADDFFHGGAISYISNNIPAALDIVTNGLRQFPEDEKLKKLEALLKQQQQQQQQEQEQKQDQQKSDPQNQADQQNQEKADQNQDEKKPDQKDQQQSSEDKRPGGQQQAEGRTGRQEQMTPEQALRVLDATKGEEALLPLQKLQPQPPLNPHFKDW